MNICDICGEKSDIELCEEMHKVTYKSVSNEIKSRHKKCNVCGCEFADAEILKYNKEQFEVFKKSVDSIKGI